MDFSKLMMIASLSLVFVFLSSSVRVRSQRHHTGTGTVQYQFTVADGVRTKKTGQNVYEYDY
jgi:hypothetical protein